MPSPKLVPLLRTDAERELLEALVRKRTASQSLALRARIVLACAEDRGIAPLTAVADRFGVSREMVRKWRVRFTGGPAEGAHGRAAARGAAEDHRRAGRGGGDPGAEREGPRAGHALVNPGDGGRDRPVAVVAPARRPSSRAQQLRQAPGTKRQVILGRLSLGDLLDLPPLRQRELRRATALVLRVQRPEPVSVEVPDHIPHPVLTCERNLRDRGHIHPLRRQQHHLRPPPGHHRPAAPADDPHQPLSLVIVDLTYSQPFTHRPSLGDQHPPGKPQLWQT